MAAPKARKTPTPRPAPTKDLQPWQLVVFIVLGCVIAAIFVGFGFAKRSHDEYGQWPWSRTALPPKMYYDHNDYVGAGAGTLSGVIRVGKNPGGGIIYAASADKKTAPATIEVQQPPNGRVAAYKLAPKK